MLAYIVGNTNFNFDRQGARNIRENNRLKNTEVEIKEKIEKVKNFNPDSCYDFSDVGEDESITANESPQATIRSMMSQEEDGLKDKRRRALTYQNLKTSVIVINSGNAAKQILFYKQIIKWLDIVASVLIICGCLLAQIENESYYWDNIYDRVGVVQLITDLSAVNGNLSQIDLNSYNITYLKNKTFEETINFTDYKNLPIPMQISNYSAVLRVLMCIFTLVSIPLIVIGRYAEFVREYIYGQNLEMKFHHSPLISTTIYELLLITPFQYPGVNSYVIINELGGYLCLPFTSALSSLTFLRFYFVLKLFKHLTKWTSTSAEHICEKYVCKADTKFAFKAFQKENPFFILFVIFVFTCVCFGLALRTFELYYWETRTDSGGFQDWDYAWNAMWCIFVSMTTVGYGDYYSKTQVGRFITIIACMIGTYFVSMMMVFMTQKSGLHENEKKAYNLITRLKLRNDIKHQQANMILNALRMAAHRMNKNSGKLKEKDFHIKYSYEKRNVITSIEVVKNKKKIIQTFECISLKESLFDISERIDSDIKEIKNECDSLKFINEIIISFSDCQIEIAKYLKKNCYATKLFYTIIQKKPVFGLLNNVDLSLMHLFETELDRKEYMENEEMTGDEEEEFEDNIFNYDVNLDQIKDYFDFIFNNNKGHRNGVTRATKTVDFIKRKKTKNNAKLRKIQEMLKKKMSTMNTVKEIKSPIRSPKTK